MRKEFELIRTMRSGWCFFKVETQFVSAFYNVKYLKMDCLVYSYIQHLLAYNTRIAIFMFCTTCALVSKTTAHPIAKSRKTFVYRRLPLLNIYLTFY